MAIGPELPPHLAAKRKREEEEEDDQDVSSATETSARRSTTPSPRSDGDQKRRRLAGPAPPPAPLDERPPNPQVAESDEESSDDDGFGPSLPTASNSGPSRKSTSEEEQMRETSSAEKTTRRDEWMMVPPKQDDLAARMDPTKMRARGFNSGKGAKGPVAGRGEPDSIWMETPEQKRKRLQDEVLGVSSRGDVADSAPEIDNQKRAENEEKARKIREYNASFVRNGTILVADQLQEKHRSKSLYSEHQGSKKKEKEDDPSKRAFDYEKDMGSGMKIGHGKRNELLKKASDFGSRFSSGNYL